MPTFDELVEEGIEAAEEILDQVFHVELHKGLNPLHLHDFEKLTKALAASLKGHALPVEKTALKKAMDALDADWTEMTPPARGKLLAEATKYIGIPIADAILPKIEQTLKFAAKDLVPAAKKSTILTYDLKIAPHLSAFDDRTIVNTVVSQGHYIRDQYGKRSEAFSVKARGLVAAGLSEGLGSAEIAEDLRGELSMHMGRGGGYWDIVAMVFANRARTMTQLAAYHDAGISGYTWESVLDEATSDACRFMHGRKFGVAHAMQRFQDVENDPDPEAIERLQPFVQTGKDADGNAGLYYNHPDGGRTFVARTLESGVGSKDDTGNFSHQHSDAQLAEAGIHAPPLHGRCFPAGTVVEGSFTGGLKALYTGELVELKTKGGRRLVSTPNHEILTSNGLVAAHLLAKGDQVISYTPSIGGDVERSAAGAGIRQEDEHHEPMRIEEALRLLEQARESHYVDRGALYLDGDEAGFDGQIQVVGAERALLNDGDAAAPERGGDVVFKKPAIAQPGACGDSSAMLLIGGLRDSSRGAPRGAALPLNEFPIESDSLPFQPLRVGTAADIDASLHKPAKQRRDRDAFPFGDLFGGVAREVPEGGSVKVDDSSLTLPLPKEVGALGVAAKVDAGLVKACAQEFVADPNFATEILDRFPGAVALDEILEVRNLESSTRHVYDLQTGRGWFVANGILVSNCRSTIIPSYDAGTAGGGPVPAEPVAAPPKPTAGAVKAQALEDLKELDENSTWQGGYPKGDLNPIDLFPKYNKANVDPAYEHPALLGTGASPVDLTKPADWAFNAVKKKPKLEDLIATAPEINAAKVQGFIQKPKALDAAEIPKVVKYKGDLYVISGHEQLAAQKLMKQKVAYCEVVDLDKLKTPPLVHPVDPSVAPTSLGHVLQPSAHPPPAPPPPLAPALAPTPPKLQASDVLFEKTGGPLGSNAAGFYTGKDGVSRYVKFYEEQKPGGEAGLSHLDALAQAEGEHLANTLYRDLGHHAPVSNVLEHEGKVAYASNVVQGLKTLQAVGLTPALAKEAMKGFVADVLTANWDVAGASLDNMGVDAAGNLVRVDNGGSFLMRAKAGRKPLDLLNKITEWEGFFTNPSYRKIANAAGYHSAEDMKDLILPEIKKIVALKNQHGGWAGYVERISPNLPVADKAKIVNMLEERTKHLEVKAHELSLPAPVDRTQPVIGHLPPKPLPPRELPPPEGKDKSGYRQIVDKRLPKDPDQRQAVTSFTGNAYTNIRKVERAITPAEIAKAKSDLGARGYDEYKQKADHIEGFFKNPQTKTTPCTSYRGINSLSEETMRKFMTNDEFRLGASSSTSRTPGVAMKSGFGNIEDSPYSRGSLENRILFILKQKSAVAIETISGVDTENELLMHQHSTFRITGRHRAEGYKNVLVIEAEEIAANPNATH